VREDKTGGRIRCSSMASAAMPCSTRSIWRGLAVAVDESLDRKR